MLDLANAAFAATGVRQGRTKVGRDVVFRMGSPTLVHDLVRVGAHRATSILVMMTAQDEAEGGAAAGGADSSASVRTVLALRNVILSQQRPLEFFLTRCCAWWWNWTPLARTSTKPPSLALPAAEWPTPKTSA